MDAVEMATILEQAADLYESETVGWCKNTWAQPGDGDQALSLCAEGAIYAAAGVEHLALLAHNPSSCYSAMVRGDKVIKHLSFVTGERYGAGLHMWNDTYPLASKQAVIDLMKEQAKELRNAAQAPTSGQPAAA